MDDLRRATELIETAHKAIRALMKEALRAERYQELAAVAPVADDLAALIRRHQGGTLKVSSRTGSGDVEPHDRFLVQKSTRASLPAAARGDDYPRFEREGDKLVKIGWSKKDRREYEHRAPRDAVFGLAERLSTTVKPGSVFTMDAEMPFRDASGAEMPSYQAYLALAWLREIGMVEQRGKDGYSLTNGHLDLSSVGMAWDAVRIRHQNEGRHDK